MQPSISMLAKDQPFCFTCSPQVPCFNACCRNLNQILTPYDILCLKHHLAMTSTAFLATYTEAGTGPGSGLPVVSLRFRDSAALACPFVGESGCRVYPARPASCRTYPLARGVFRHRQTGRLTERWALIKETHCLGFAHGRPQTVDQWVDRQQIAVHNRMNDMLLELIAAKNRHRPGSLTPEEQRRAYTALYDLDAFRAHPPTGDGSSSDISRTPTIDASLADDTKLLLSAMAHVRKTICSVSARKGRP